MSRSSRDRTVINYAGRAEGFAQWASDDSNARAAEALRVRFLRAIAGNRGRPARGASQLRILDVGCGPGRDIAAFSALGHVAGGLDPCTELCEIARSVAGSGVLVECASPDDDDFHPPSAFGDGKSDGIWCLASLFHIRRERLPQAVRRLRSCLREGGVLMTTFPAGEACNERGADGRWVTCMPLADHSALIRSCGLDVLSADENLQIYNGVWGTVISRRSETKPRPVSAPAAPAPAPAPALPLPFKGARPSLDTSLDTSGRTSSRASDNQQQSQGPDQALAAATYHYRIVGKSGAIVREGRDLRGCEGGMVEWASR